MTPLKRTLTLEPFDGKVVKRTVPAKDGACGVRVETEYGYVDLTIGPSGTVYVRLKGPKYSEREVMRLDIGEDA